MAKFDKKEIFSASGGQPTPLTPDAIQTLFKRLTRETGIHVNPQHRDAAFKATWHKLAAGQQVSQRRSRQVPTTSQTLGQVSFGVLPLTAGVHEAVHNTGTMVDRNTFDRIKQEHAGYASWAVWAEPTDKPKANIGDLRILDPDENPALLQTLRNNVIMIGLNISRPVPEPFRNFHDPRPQSQDYKIRYAFAGTPYYGAYMTDVIKGLVMVESRNLMRHLRANPSLVRENVERLLGELTDLKCDRPAIVAFGGDAHRIVANAVPARNYSRLVGVAHYSARISKEEYRQLVIKQF